MLFERLEDRLLLDGTPLGSDPLIFDPTPDSVGGEQTIGTIAYELTGTNQIKVTYTISPGNQATYDLSAVKTTINFVGSAEPPLNTNTTGLADNTESYVHTFALDPLLPAGTTGLDIDACATISAHDVASVGAVLPTFGTVSVSTNGLMTGLSSYFDTILSPGRIPTSTDTSADTVTFASPTGWATGAAVRVVQGYTTAPTNTGLVTPPTVADDTNSATYFVRDLGLNTYSFHTTYNDAVAAINPKDITAAIPTTGEIIIAGENDAIAFLGQTPDYTALGLTAQDTSQTPLADGVAPASTKTTLTTTTGPLVTATNLVDDTVDLASAVTWVSGDRVQVSATGGGLTAGTTYFVRMSDSDTVSFHTTWAGATAVLPTVNRVNITLAIALTTTVNSVDGDDETVTFASDPAWATGTPVRVSATGGGLNVNTTYFARSLGSGVYSFFDTALNATNTDADLNPLNGRKDLTASITASVFANLTTVSFANPHGWATGTQVRVTATGGGLTAGANYYVNANDADTVSFHGTEANASGNISPVTFTAPISAAVFNAQSVTFTTNHGLAEGAAVFVTADGAGLNDNTTYYVDVIDADTVGFYTSRANALLAGATGRVTITSPTIAVSTFNAEELSFDNDHNWATGTVVRVGASVGGLAAGTNYYVKKIDADTIALYDTLANAQAGGTTGLKIYTAPITALVTPMFDGWCVDNDRFIGGGEYIAEFFSSYEPSSFPDTTDHPKDQFGTDAGLMAVNTSATPSATNTTTDQVTFTAAHPFSTGQAVRVTATDDGLIAGTTYYVRSINGTTVSFHPTAAAANNAGPVPASTIFANTGLIPSATNITAGVETVDFAAAHGWATGDVVRVSATGGGLTVGANNFARAIDADTISFYDTAANAGVGGLTGLRNLTAAITATVYKVDLASTDDTVTFNAGHGFVTGSVVNVTATGGGLTATTTYYLYDLGGNTFSFHTASPTPDNKVNLTANITTSVNERVDLTAAISASTIVFRAESIDFAATTNWPTGTKVRVDVSDGGLTAGTSYYVRQQNVVGGAVDANSVSFYTTRENAQAGGLIGLITLTDPMDATTKVYVPEDLVENPENLDVMNWVLNQKFQLQLAVGQAPTATNTATTTQVPASTSDANTGLIPSATNITAGVETVDFAAAHGWATGDVVRVSATGGGLTVGANNFARAIDADTISFYDTAANAGVGGLTGLRNLTAAITATVYKVDLASTDDTVTFNAGHGFVTGDIVTPTASVGGLTGGTVYTLYNVSGDTFSFHTAAAATAANKVNLTAAIAAGVHLQSDDTVTMTASPNYGWTTGLRVQVSATAGGLAAGTDYYIRAISTTTLGFFATAADATNNVNRIDLTAAIEPAVVRPYYTEGDVQRTVWELVENNPGNPGHSQERVNEIMALADAAVGLNLASVDFVPDCDGTVAVIIQPFEVEEGSNEQITIAQITIAEIPNYCVTVQNCQDLQFNLGSISGVKFEDMDGDGTKDDVDGGLAGWTVYLDDDDNLLEWTDAGALNGVWDAGEGERWTTTAANGSYSFTGLLPGTYYVKEVQKTGWTQTKGVGQVAVAVSVDEQAPPVLADQDLGNFKLIDISGVKVHDIDRDGADTDGTGPDTGGINDAGDLRLAGLRVYLDDGDGVLEWTDAGAVPNGVWDAGEGERWTTTNANGEYFFNDVGPSPSGSYNVVEDLTSLLNSAQWQPTAGTPLFHTVTAASGMDVAGKDFYNHKFSSSNDPGGPEYLTYSQGGYAGKGVPGQYLLVNFAMAFPSPSFIVVPRTPAGSGGDITLANGAAVQTFLKAKTSTNLETQYLALKLSVGFDNETSLPGFDKGTSSLGDLTLCNLAAPYTAANGLTVSGFLAQVAFYLDGSASYNLGLASGDLIFLLNNINLGFDAGAVTPWAEMHLS